MEDQDREILEEQLTEEEQQPETPKYVPRPAWQVWGARVALVLFIALVIMYMLNIARGGR